MPINRALVQNKLQADQEMRDSWDYLTAAVHLNKLPKAIWGSFMQEQAALVASINREIGVAPSQERPTKLEVFDSAKQELADLIKQLVKMRADKSITAEKRRPIEQRIDEVQKKLGSLVTETEKELTGLITKANSLAKKDTPSVTKLIQAATTLVETNRLTLKGTVVAKPVWEFFDREAIIINRFLTLIDLLDNELKKTGFSALSDADATVVKNYKTILEATINKYLVVDYHQAMVDMYTPIDQVLINLGNVIKVPAFKQYTSSLEELGSMQPRIDRINTHFSTPPISDITIVPVQHVPRIPLKLVPILDLLNKAQTEKDISSVCTTAAKASVESSLAIGKDIADVFNKQVGNSQSSALAEKRMHGKGKVNSEELRIFVLRDILSQNLNSPLQLKVDPKKEVPETLPVRFPDGYLNAMLAKAYSELFDFEKNELVVKDAQNNKKYKAIHEAFGVVLEIDPQAKEKTKKMSCNPQNLNAKILSKLDDEYPNLLWRVLKTTIPVSSTFSAKDKIQAYIDVAKLIKEKKLGEDKYEGIMSLIQAAYETAKAHPSNEVIELFRINFMAGVKDSIGHWMSENKSGKKDDAYGKVIRQMIADLNSAKNQKPVVVPAAAAVVQASIPVAGAHKPPAHPPKKPELSESAKQVFAGAVATQTPKPLDPGPPPPPLSTHLVQPSTVASIAELAAQQTIMRAPPPKPDVSIDVSAGQKPESGSPGPSTPVAAAVTGAPVADKKPVVKPTAPVSDLGQHEAAKHAAVVASKDSRITELEERNKSLSAELAAATELVAFETADKVKQVNAANLRLKVSEAQRKNAVGSMNTAEAALENAKKELGTTRKELTAITEREKAASEQIVSLQTENRSLTQARSQAKAENDSQRQMLDQLKAKNDALNTEVEALREKVKPVGPAVEKEVKTAQATVLKLIQLANTEPNLDTQLIEYCEALLVKLSAPSQLKGDELHGIQQKVNNLIGLTKVVNDIVKTFRQGESWWPFWNIGFGAKADKIESAMHKIPVEKREALITADIKKSNHPEKTALSTFIDTLLTSRHRGHVMESTRTSGLFKDKMKGLQPSSGGAGPSGPEDPTPKA